MINEKIKIKLSKQEEDLLFSISDVFKHDCKCDQCFSPKPLKLQQKITEIYVNGIKLTSLPHEDMCYYVESCDYWVRKNEIN